MREITEYLRINKKTFIFSESEIKEILLKKIESEQLLPESDSQEISYKIKGGWDYDGEESIPYSMEIKIKFIYNDNVENKNNLGSENDN